MMMSHSRNASVANPWHDHSAWPKVEHTMRLLRWSSVIILVLTLMTYGAVFGGFGVGVASLLKPPMSWFLVGWMTIGCTVSLIADAVVVRALRQRKPWAWTGALLLFCLESGSLLLMPLTIMGIIALGDSEVRAAFETVPSTQPEPVPGA